MAETQELLLKEETDALETTGLAHVIERLAINPQVDVMKLEKIIELQERILSHNAKSAFNRAFADLQADLPTVIERGKTDKGTYAQLEDIVEAVRPFLKTHGFSLSHATEWPDKTTVKVVGILTHTDGYERRSEFMANADTSGSKNAIQALGSSVAYGRRYTVKDLLNIVTRHEDDDGGASEKAKAPEAPKGYDDWLADYESTAFNGLPALEAAWKASKPQFRDYLTRYDPRKRAAIKSKAESIKGQA